MAATDTKTQPWTAAATPRTLSDAPSRRSSETETDPTYAPAVLPDNKEAQTSAPALDPRLDPKTVRPIHGWKWAVSFATILVLCFLYGLDVTITADIQPAIVETYNAVDKIAWIGAAFALGSVATMLLYGQAFGLFETKKLFIAGIVLFEVGSAICGGAPTMDALIVGRTIAGIGGTGIYLGCLTFVQAFTTLQEQPLYNATLGLVWGFGGVLGPLIGGGFAISKVGWRWCFYINLLIAAAFAPAILFLLPTNHPQPNRSVRDKLKSMDWAGGILIMTVYVTFVVAIGAGGTLWAWNSYQFIIMICFFGVSLIAFSLQQYYQIFTDSVNHIFPTQFLKSRTMLLLFVVTSASGTIMSAGTYYIPLIFQFVFDDSAIMAAVRLLPFMAVVVSFNMFTGGMIPKLGYYWVFFTVGGCFVLIGGSLMYTIKSTTAVSKIYGYTIITGTGVGLTLQGGYAIACATVIERFQRPQDIPYAISFMNVSQVGSVAVSLTIAGAIFNNLAYKNLQSALASYGLSPAELRSAVAGTQSQFFKNASPDARAAAVNAIIDAMDRVFIMFIVAGAVILLSSFAMRKEKLFQINPAAAAGGIDAAEQGQVDAEAAFGQPVEEKKVNAAERAT